MDVKVSVSLAVTSAQLKPSAAMRCSIAGSTKHAFSRIASGDWLCLAAYRARPINSRKGNAGRKAAADNGRGGAAAALVAIAATPAPTATPPATPPHFGL